MVQDNIVILPHNTIRTIYDSCNLLRRLDKPIRNVIEEIRDIQNTVNQPVQPISSIAMPERFVSWFRRPEIQTLRTEHIKDRIDSVLYRIPYAIETVIDNANSVLNLPRVQVNNTVHKNNHILNELDRDAILNIQRIEQKINNFDMANRQLREIAFRQVEGLAGGSWDIFGWFWRAIKNVVGHVRTAVSSAFTHVGNTFAWVGRTLSNAIQGVINWTWRGLDGIGRGIKAFAINVVNGLRRIYEWILTGLTRLWSWLIRVMKSLFEISENLIMKYTLWQARAAYNVGKIVSNTF